jgi:hypothetical protein
MPLDVEDTLPRQALPILLSIQYIIVHRHT